MSVPCKTKTFQVVQIHPGQRLAASPELNSASEEGSYQETDVGTPQGGNLSPVLSNTFLHYALDLWFERKIKPTLKGYAQLTRFADDFIVVFEHEQEAKAFESSLRERLAAFSLKIKESKSAVVEFGREAWRQAKNGGPKSDTFDFLGFTHFTATTRRGFFKVDRKTSAKKLAQKLKALKGWIKAVRSQVSLKDWRPIFKAKLIGHFRYYGIRGNMKKLRRYRRQSIVLAYKWINRRSQKRSYNWESFSRFLKWNPLPQPRIYY